MTAATTDPRGVRGRAELRVVVLAVFPRDAELTCKCLAAEEIECVAADTDDALFTVLDDGAAAIIVAAERLEPRLVERLRAHLDRQPAWSDLPIVIPVSPSDAVEEPFDGVHPLGNVTTIERPIRR